MNSIPELSFKDIEKGDLKSIALLSSALEDHGFFSITDHGLSKELLDKCYSSSIDFFNLDHDLKDAYNSKSSKGARGYTPKGIETAVGEKIADQKEFWHHGPIIDDSFDHRIPENIVMKEIKDFNDNFDNLYLHITCSFFADSVLGGGLLQKPIHRIGERDREQNLNTMSLNNTNNSN